MTLLSTQIVLKVGLWVEGRAWAACAANLDFRTGFAPVIFAEIVVRVESSHCEARPLHFELHFSEGLDVAHRMKNHVRWLDDLKVLPIVDWCRLLSVLVDELVGVLCSLFDSGQMSASFRQLHGGHEACRRKEERENVREWRG